MDGTAIDIHMTILIIDEVDIPTLLIITTQDVGMTVDADPTHLNMAPVAVIVTTTLPRIAVDGEGRVMTTRDRHHHDEEARDIEMMTAAAANVATDTLIHPLPHVRKKETDAGETTTLLVADVKVTKKMSPTADVPAMTKEITHGLAELPLTELPLMCQKHMYPVIAITHLVMSSLILRGLRIIHGHQLSLGLIIQSKRTLNHPPAHQ